MIPFDNEKQPFAWANSMHAQSSFCFLSRSANGDVYEMEAWPSDTPWNCMGWEAAPMHKQKKGAGS